MKRCVQFQLLLLTLSVYLYPPSVLAGEHDEYWPHKCAPSSPLRQGMGPQGSDVTFIINGRAVGHTAPPSDSEQTEEKLRDALFQAKQMETDPAPVVVGSRPLADLSKVQTILATASTPNLFVRTLGNTVKIMYQPYHRKGKDSNKASELLESLASLAYKKKDYHDTIELLTESLDLKKKQFGEDSPEAAEVLEFLGLTYRAVGDWTKAESSYLKALTIRQQLSDQAATAATYSSLANVYFDSGEFEKGKKLETFARRIVEDDGVTVADRPIPTSISGGRIDSWSKYQRVVFGHQQAKASENAEFSAISALVRNLLVTMFPDEGGSYIFGTAQVGLDRTNSLVFNRKIAEVGKTEKEGGKSDSKVKVSELRDFQVVLCKGDARPYVNAAIARYARRYGFSMADYQVSWPGIREQAKELILDMESVVKELAPKVTETNDNGEFEFKDVKKGPYSLFGFLITKDKAMYWIETIEASGKTPVRYDFLRDNATYLWEKNKAAPKSSATQMTPGHSRTQPNSGLVAYSG